MFMEMGHLARQRPQPTQEKMPSLLAGIVDQLVHEPLAEPLLLGETGVAAGHFGEVGVHAGVPAAEPLDAVAGVEVPDVVALAGGADKGAGPAAQAGFRKLRPLGTVKEGRRGVAAEALQR